MMSRGKTPGCQGTNRQPVTPPQASSITCTRYKNNKGDVVQEGPWSRRQENPGSRHATGKRAVRSFTRRESETPAVAETAAERVPSSAAAAARCATILRIEFSHKTAKPRRRRVPAPAAAAEEAREEREPSSFRAGFSHRRVDPPSRCYTNGAADPLAYTQND
ncbi:hypothetical protein HPB50_023400 [Hyalomma asiaticum]|uniref:Uncharacterized protein n=1 Tax=Hyalomma asiaticum TaxID=266040 RepID=A0ACB7S1N4_HYAAI|nr:hypothetical protein HPB50_023400 [Hyalomma asiaticum]